MTEIINNKLGKAFPPAMAFAGYTFIGIGLFFIIEVSLIGIIIAVIGGIMGFTTTGMLIDPANNKYKNYTSLFGIRFGSWQSFADYPYIAILRSHISTTAFSKANRPATTSKETYYDICLLKEKHLQKLMIKRCRKEEEAIAEVKLLVEKLDKKLTAYKPEISRARKR
jgi:hypothetical protein